MQENEFENVSKLAILSRTQYVKMPYIFKLNLMFHNVQFSYILYCASDRYEQL